MAREAQAFQDNLDDFQYMEIMVENNNYGSSEVTTTDLQNWAERSDMQGIPILNGSEGSVWQQYERGDGFPSVVHLDAQMRILSIDEEVYDPTVFR